MMSLRSAPLVVLLCAASVLAHLEMSYPPPLHSKFNPNTPESLKDYSMTSPLVDDGTYPCKGFINNPKSNMVSVATWQAGQTYNVTISGSATHGGGSAQYSLSYDDGQSWHVILSYVGGAMIEGNNTDVTIPADAPSGTPLFSWSWFNHEGNHEMYQNCAVITIVDGGKGLDSADYPAPFVANAGVNDCTTIEFIDVVFPDPGKNVKYGGTYKTTKPTTPAGFTGSNCVGPEAGGSMSNSSSSATAPSAGATGSYGATSPNASPIAASTPALPANSSAGKVDIAPKPSTTPSSGFSQPASPAATDTTSSTDTPTDTATASSSSGTGSNSGAACNRKRRRSLKPTVPVAKRHQRLVRRASHQQRDRPKRVAASQAKHVGL